MDPIYVTGHRNPDTDSIVAAMAYAALRNACGNREYEAACLGHLSDETQTVLDRFGFQPPKRISNMYTQVQDLDFDQPPILSAAVTEDRAWKLLQEQKTVSALPVVNEDGTLYGMLSREDVASYNMELVSTGFLESVPLFNVLSVLEGKVLNEAGESIDTVSGDVTIALPQSRENLLFSRPNSVVLCGHQPDMIRRALELNVNCLVLCQAELDDDTEQVVGNRHPVYAECYGDKVDHTCDRCSDDHTDQFRVACKSPDTFIQAQEPEYYYAEYCIDPYCAEIGLQVLFLDAVESAVKADPQCSKVRYQNCYKVIYHQQQSDQFPVFKFFLSVSSAFAHFLLLIPSLIPFLYFQTNVFVFLSDKLNKPRCSPRLT